MNRIEGWQFAGKRNSWSSSVRRHYFRNSSSLCGKYSQWEADSDDLDPPEARKPSVDCVICTRLLEKELKA